MNKHYFEADGVDELYKQLIASISEEPQFKTAPRGMDIKENIGVVAKLTNPRDCLVSLKERKMNYAFAAIEKLEYLSGQTDPDRLVFYNSNFNNYRSEYGIFDGAYPERLGYWYRHIYNLLKSDNDTRQAVMTIYGAQDRHKSKDIPCTLSFQFLIREGKLNMIAHMRSNDLLWGFPYDTNGFCFIQEALAAALNVELGTYELHAGSLHIYTEREEQLTNLLGPTEKTQYVNPIIPSYESWDKLQNDLKKFWVAEYSYRNDYTHSAVVEELPLWLEEYYNAIVDYIDKKNNKQLPL
jgi:thymidylate synthase